MTAVQSPFWRDHAGSLLGSCFLHGVLVLIVVAMAWVTPPTRRVVPAMIEATLVSSHRNYVTPVPHPAPAATPPLPAAVAPTPVPVMPTPVPKPAPKPAPVKVPTKVLKVPPGVTEKPKPAVAPKPKVVPFSKADASALERELRDNEQARQAAQVKAAQEAARARAEAQVRAQAAVTARNNAVRQEQVAGETSQYLAEIKARVEQAWSRPASARKGVQCTLEVDQSPGGTVLQARVINPCNGDEAVRASIRDAALRASPLPVPKNGDIFQRTLHLVFSPDE